MTADLVTLGGSLEDGFDLNAARLVLHELERVLCEIIGMKVRLEELVRRAVCMSDQIGEHVLFTAGSVLMDRASRMNAAIS